MNIVDVHFNFKTGVPDVPEDVKARVRNGEHITIRIVNVGSGFVKNALEHGVAGLWIDGARVEITDGATMARNNRPGANGWANSSGGPNSAAVNGEPSGRWPANVIHDGSDEVLAGFPETTSGKMKAGTQRQNRNGYTGPMPKSTAAATIGDSGSAARFFYCAKASRRERNAGLDGMEERFKLRDDLTTDQLDYVTAELKRHGVNL